MGTYLTTSPHQTTKNLTILNYGKQRASKQRKSRIFVPLVGLEPTTSPQGGSALPTELLGLKNVRWDTSKVPMMAKASAI